MQPKFAEKTSEICLDDTNWLASHVVVVIVFLVPFGSTQLMFPSIIILNIPNFRARQE